jgi:hypothetical protein
MVARTVFDLKRKIFIVAPSTVVVRVTVGRDGVVYGCPASLLLLLLLPLLVCHCCCCSPRRRRRRRRRRPAAHLLLPLLLRALCVSLKRKH